VIEVLFRIAANEGGVGGMFLVKKTKKYSKHALIMQFSNKSISFMVA
jgi:hypothetical protein